jgi:hypothetical protein
MKALLKNDAKYKKRMTDSKWRELLGIYRNQILTYSGIDDIRLLTVCIKKRTDIVEPPMAKATVPDLSTSTEPAEFSSSFASPTKGSTMPTIYESEEEETPLKLPKGVTARKKKGKKTAKIEEVEDTPDDISYSSYDTTGTGLKTQRPKHLQPSEKMIHTKYFINTTKLKNNVLCIKYAKNRHIIPIKEQIISNPVKKIIIQMMNGNLDKQAFLNLTKIEKHLVRSLLPYFQYDRSEMEDDDGFFERFEILKGQILAGNDNANLKREMKQYLLHALQTNRISRANFNSLLLELSL